MILKKLRNVWRYYPELSLMELVAGAAKATKLLWDYPRMLVNEMIALPEGDGPYEGKRL